MIEVKQGGEEETGWEGRYLWEKNGRGGRHDTREHAGQVGRVRGKRIAVRQRALGKGKWRPSRRSCCHFRVHLG